MYYGERDYDKISSLQGPCYYAAGHIYHYLMAHWLHLKTERAEDIVKFAHVVVHSMINYYVAKIAFRYHSS